MEDQKSLCQPVELQVKLNEVQESSAQDSMQQWLTTALNSSDARTRIALNSGVSKGVFGFLHLGNSEELQRCASNDSDYSDDARCA